jgi:spermidine synthase
VVPWLFARGGDLLLGAGEMDSTRYLALSGAIIAAALLPWCLAMGCTFPFMLAFLREEDARQTTGFSSLYLANVLGAVVGTLLSAVVLIELFGFRRTLGIAAGLLLATGFLLVFVGAARSALPTRWGVAALAVWVGLCLRATLVNVDWAELYATVPGSEVRRDHTATVVSLGAGMNRQLIVNGIAMTRYTPVTKFMAHLPLAMLDHEPRSAVAICMGMGTTFLSLLSWDIEVTAVELSPSVTRAFAYYWEDAERVLGDPKARLVVDDGRRFLRRADERYDVITIDPPPPIEGGGLEPPLLPGVP